MVARLLRWARLSSALPVPVPDRRIVPKLAQLVALRRL
jgi:hypothetical protein